MSIPESGQYNLDDAILTIVPENIRTQEPNLSIQKLVQLKDNTKLTFVLLKRYGSWDNEHISMSGKEMVIELLWLYYKNLDLGSKFKSVFSMFWDI
jgi:hypothetical protein